MSERSNVSVAVGDAPLAGSAEVRQFRKKPVEIEAVQYNPLDQLPLIEFLGDAPWSISMGFRIQTLEGVMTVSPGDWVIKGVQGEFYPCKPDIFAATYDEVAR